METCWTIVERAARGDARATEAFALAYLPVVRAYLGARWRSSPMIAVVDDAVQDVFMDCLKEEGPMGRLDRSRPGRFRTWLYGVSQNVARRHEERRAIAERKMAQVADRERAQPRESETLSRVFDRAWARTMIRRAAARMRREANDDAGMRRVEILRCRFQEGMPIRKIAAAWGLEAPFVHHEYAKAREEFKAALRAEVMDHGGISSAEIERECAAMLQLLKGP